MNFAQHTSDDEPEINLIPLIDVLLVMLIFLAATTTFSRLTELEVALPAVSQAAQEPTPGDVRITVGADGRYAIDGRVLATGDVPALAQALRAAVEGRSGTVVLDADALATHQSVVNVMEAARQAGVARLHMAAQPQ